MKNVHLTVRSCPEDLHEVIQQSADRNHRSLRGEVIAWLSQKASQLKTEKMQPQKALQTREKLRRNLKTFLSESEMNQARTEGRK